MPRTVLHPAIGTGVYKELTKKVIRFVRYGCTNRPFFHIVVAERHIHHRHPPIEQVGTFDPMPNSRNQKLVSFNFERIQWWLGKGNVVISKPVEELLGLAGFLPIHPLTYTKAWRNRKAADEETAKAAEPEKSFAEAS